MGLFDKFKSDVRSLKLNQSLNKTKGSFTVLTKEPTLSTNKVNGTGTAVAGPGNVPGNTANAAIPGHLVPNIPNHVRSPTAHSSFLEFSNVGSDSSCTSSESHNYKRNLKNKDLSQFNELTINELDQLPALETKVNANGNNGYIGNGNSANNNYNGNVNTANNGYSGYSGNGANNANDNPGSRSPRRKPPSELPNFEAEAISTTYDGGAPAAPQQPLNQQSYSPKQHPSSPLASSFSAPDSKTIPAKTSPPQSKRIVSPQIHPRTQFTKGKSPPVIPNTPRKISPITNASPWKPTPEQAAYQQEGYISTPENELYSESNLESSNPPVNQQYWDQQQQFPGYNNYQQQMYYQQQQQQMYYQQQQQAQYQNYYQPQQVQVHPYYNHSPQEPSSPLGNNFQYKNTGSTNELVAATRKSTIQRRFSSAPSVNQSIGDNSKRVISMDSNFKPNAARNVQENNLDDELDGDSAKPYNAAPVRDVSDKDLKRHISDYSKFLFDEGDLDEEEEDEEDEVLLTKKTGPDSIKPPLLRSVSADSKTSFNSIQSDDEHKFKVGSTQERTDRLQSITSNKARAKSHSPENKFRQGYQQNYQPQMPGHYRNSSFVANNNMSVDLSALNGGSSPYTNGMVNFSSEYAGAAYNPNSRRQSMAAGTAYDPNSRRQSMTAGTRMRTQSPQLRNRGSMAPFGSPNMGFQPQSNIPRIHDGTINRKIDEFIELRMIISSGNKSLVYRLKWVQQLISAVNYNLYCFINIKGEPVGPEFAEHNKQLFVKSAVTHLFKLLKEDTGKKKFANIRKEVYYIYGCLLKHDYVAQFDEDFGIEKDIELSIEMFEKCLELNPIDYKSLYKLGEIFEFEYPEEIDKALDYYKDSANFSYNRAIYRIALLYINCPELRSLKFIKYLTDLANIHIDDIEVKSDDEFEEVSDVIGLAAYELGKIYEGIYPGDLAIDDEFVQRALDIAPVNYAKSLTYYNKSAKLNCVFGLVKLGSIYEYGELNRQQNPNKSIQWYTKATTSPFIFKRHPDAMLGLSRWNLNGSGGSNRQIPGPNPQAAVMWCERAVKEFESVDAMFFMGELSEMGLTTTNPNMWYSQAYNLGHEEAGRKLGLQPQYNGEGYDEESPELSENEEEQGEIRGEELQEGGIGVVQEEGRGDVLQQDMRGVAQDEHYQNNSTVIMH